MKPQVRRVLKVRGEGERLRQETLDAATRILEETGREDALSLRGVAREVGISAPSVYLHFKDKAELITTVLDAAYRTLAAAMGAAGDAAGVDPWERIGATTAAYRRFAIDKPRRYRLMFSLEQEPERQPFADTPLGTVLQAWTHAVDTYLAAIAPARRSEAEDRRHPSVDRLARPVGPMTHPARSPHQQRRHSDRTGTVIAAPAAAHAGPSVINPEARRRTHPARQLRTSHRTPLKRLPLESAGATPRAGGSFTDSASMPAA